MRSPIRKPFLCFIASFLFIFCLVSCSSHVDHAEEDARNKSEGIPLKDENTGFSINGKSSVTSIEPKRFLIYYKREFYDLFTRRSINKQFSRLQIVAGEQQFYIPKTFLGYAKPESKEIYGSYATQNPENGSIFLELKLTTPSRDVVLLYVPIDLETAKGTFPDFNFEDAIKRISLQENSSR